jgi:glutathione S-transferase
VTTRHASSPEEQKAFVLYFNVRGLTALEALLAAVHDEIPGEGGYAVGSALTAADVFLVPQIATARRFGVDLSPYSRLLAVEAAAMTSEHARGALPENQPGAPPGR